MTSSRRVTLSTDVDKVVAAMAHYSGWWALAGGWSIDTWLGMVTRHHHDVEVSVLRRESVQLWDYLVETGCEVFQIDPPGSGCRPWARGEPVAAPAHQLQARRDGFVFDLFLEEASEDDWVFRRKPDIVRRLATVTWSGDPPVLVPEVQLLFMAKSNEPKNEHDFQCTVPRLDDAARSWLRKALALTDPDHRWLNSL